MDKKKIILLLVFFVGYNCKDNSKLYEINFELNYCQLFQNAQENVKLNSLVILEKETFYIDSYYNESLDLIIDNVIDLNLNKNNQVLINSSKESFKLLSLDQDFPKKISKIFEDHLLDNTNLKLLIYYENEVNYKSKINLIKPILKYVKNKNDILAYELFNKEYFELNRKEVLELKKKFYPILYFQSCKLQPLNSN